MFQLIKKWIENLKNYADDLNTKYIDSRGKYDLPKDFDGTINWKFTNYSLLVVTMADILQKRTLIGSTDVGPLGVLRHVWWPLEFNFVDIRMLQKVIKNNRTTY